MASRRHRDKAVTTEAFNFLMIFGSLNSSSIIGEKGIFKYTSLRGKNSKRELIAFSVPR